MKKLKIVVALLLMTGLSIIPFINNVHSQILPSTLQGGAPLLVHFDAVCSPQEFQHSFFKWNFGDINAPNWGTDLKSQNIAEGPITAHVFETPGVFQVTLFQRNEDGFTFSDTIEITVQNPDAIFESPLTICVNPASDHDFSGAPIGALHISTDSIHSITSFAMAGNRILLKRGGVWNVYSTLNWPQNNGPVIIGAYGAGINPDPLGIYENNPQIIINNGHYLPMDYKQHWTVMDLSLSDPSGQNGSFGGAESFHHWLFLRVKVSGFQVPIGWSSWNNPIGNSHVDHMGIISCIFENATVNVGYVGSERLMILGSIFRNASESHVLRVWQCYKGVIAHNKISGSSLNTNTGRHALKFHGPSEDQIATTDWNHLNKRTQFSLISDNVFGTSGPWPVMVAPQDNWSDERLSYIIFERNQYFSDFGNASSLSLQPSVIFSFIGSNFMIRNNIIDASSQGAYFTGILVQKNAIVPAPENIEIYHNTIYKYADPNGQIWYGIAVLDSCGTITIRNNLVEFPYVCAGHFSVNNQSPNTEFTNNVLNSTITFENPDHVDPFQRSFRLHQNSLSAINMGFPVSSVYNDFDGITRPIGSGYDIGAFEFIPPVGIHNGNTYLKGSLYPNPTDGIVHIKSELLSHKIELFDITGILITTYLESNLIHVTNLPSGVYLVRIFIKNQRSTTHKLFVVR